MKTVYVPLVLLFLFLLTPMSRATAANQGWQIITRNNKQGLTDAEGNEVIPPEYEALGWADGTTHVYDGVIGYLQNKRWGMVTVKNKRLTKAVYLNLAPFQGNLIMASHEEQASKKRVHGLLNTQGRVVVQFQYNSMDAQGNTIAVSLIEGSRLNYGILNADGELIPVAYKRIKKLPSGQFAVTNHANRVALFSNQGQPFSVFELDSVQYLNNQYSQTWQHGRAALVLNSTGKQRLPHHYQSMRLTPNGNVEATTFTTWQTLDSSSQQLSALFYENVNMLCDGTYLATANGATRWVTEADNLLAGKNDTSVVHLAHELVVAKTKGKFGVISPENSMVVPFRYDTVLITTDLIFAGTYNKRGMQWQVWPHAGPRNNTATYRVVGSGKLDRYPVQRNGLWGYLNGNGNEVINCQFEAAGQFTPKGALVSFHGDRGLIGINGQWRIRPRPNQPNLTWGNGPFLLMPSGFQTHLVTPQELVKYTSDHQLSPHPLGYLETTRYQQYGLRNHYGQQLAATEMDALHYDSLTGQCELIRNGLAALINSQGKTIVPFADGYERILPARQGMIGIKKGGKYGFIDPQRRLIIAYRYDSVGLYSAGRAPIQIRGKWGLIDQKERIIIQPLYDEVLVLPSGVIRVRQGNRYGVITPEGEISTPVAYGQILPAGDNQLMYIGKQNGKYCLINAAGYEVFKPRYQHIQTAGTLYIVRWKGKYGVLDRYGITVLPIAYQQLAYVPCRNLFLAALPSQTEVIE